MNLFSKGLYWGTSFIEASTKEPQLETLNKGSLLEVLRNLWIRALYYGLLLGSH